MENDIRNETNENLIDINKYFQLDFSEQDLKGNRKFEEFKKQKLNELGKDAKLFHCKKDNIYFYVSKKEYKVHPCYFKKCPLCNNNVCYFCERNTSKSLNEGGNCCVKLQLYYLFFYSGYEYSKKDLKEIFNEENFCLIILSLLLPFLNIISIFMIIFASLFLRLSVKDKNLSDNSDNLGKLSYTDLLTKKGMCGLILISIISILTYIFFAICYFFVYYCLILILLIISLFTKFYPFKYYFGIFKGIK